MCREVEGVAGDESSAARGAPARSSPASARRRPRRWPDPPQRRQPLGDQVLVRREGVVGQRLPVGEDGDAQRRREEGDLVGEALRVGGLGGEDRERRAAARAACVAKRASSRASAEPGGRGSAKRLPGAMSGRCMKAARSRDAARAKRDFRWRDRGATAAYPSGPPIDPTPMPTSPPPAAACYALVPVRRHRRARRRADRQAVRRDRRPRRWSPTRWRRSSAVPRLEPDAGRRSRPTTTQFEAPGRPAGGARARGRALRRRHARRDRGRRPRRAAPSSARAPTTGCWCTTPRAAWCAPNGSTALIDACRDDAVGGLLALPVADTLKRAEGDRAVRDAAARRRLAGADAADVPPRRCSPTRWRGRRRERDRRGERDRGGRPARRSWCRARRRTSRSRSPDDFAIAEALLRARRARAA